MNDLSEHIERQALESLYLALSPAFARALGASAESVDGVFVGACRALPRGAIVLNRAIGLGLAQPARARTVEALVAHYRRAGISRYFLHGFPGHPSADLAAWTAAAGLARARSWQKFSRPRRAVTQPPCSLQIRPVGPAEGAAFAGIACRAFDLGEVAEPWLARLPGLPGWKVFMSFDGELPVGTGAVFINEDGHAWMDFGATAPSHRRRGSQAALLAARLGYAMDHGCTRLFTCTGEAVPGDPQHSFHNLLRAGFSPTYLRANFAPATPVAGGPLRRVNRGADAVAAA